MKTMITLAIAVLFAATAARAEVVTKGGAAGLMKAPRVATTTPVAAKNCEACKSEFVTVAAPAFKGSRPTTTSVIERHACAACGTKWVTSGHGKARVEVASHTCKGCAM